ncbi:MAG: ABC transporter permease [Shinella sp.]|nr:ABC transporter permease [Shinella sp.]
MNANIEAPDSRQAASLWRRLPAMSGGVPQILPAFIVIFLVFNIPIASMLGRSLLPLDEPFANYQELFSRTVYLKVIWNTFFIAIVTTIICCLLGYPLCYWMWKLSGRWRLIVVALVALTFWVSILVRAYAWIVILGNDGIVNQLILAVGLTTVPVPFMYNRLGVVIGTTNVLLPFLILPLFAAMMRLDKRLLLAAESLGASKNEIFWKIFFPLTMPALLAGGILIFILTLGFFITPAILGGGRVPMVANMMDLLINRLPKWELAAAIASVLLAITMCCFFLYQRLNSRL